MTRSCCRERTENQRGFVLISVLVVALLYFGLLELMLIESTAAMRSAQRFRARVVAHVLAENAAELAARDAFESLEKTINLTDEHGTMSGKFMHLPQHHFQIDGRGTSAGAAPQTATVKIFGRGHAGGLHIDRTIHSQ